ncbi:MAG TPA: MFS transporter [Candidatus Paceibacterota bacterium]|nr:MFS transporter [Candidatus Paceibacterota bacterium]
MAQPMKNLFSHAFPLHTLNRDLKILFVSNLFASFGDGLTIYLLPLFIRNLNATPENVGFLYSVLMVASATTIIPGGFLADRYDLKKIMIIGWAVWVPVPILFAFATDWTQLIPAMFFYGVLFSGPASSAYIVGRAQEDKMASTFSTLAAAWGLGYMFAPTVAGYLTGNAGVQWVFILTAFFYFVTTVMLTLISSQHTKTRELDKATPTAKKTGLFRRRKIVYLSVLFGSVMFLLSLVFPLVPQFLTDVYGYDVAYIGVLGSFTYFGGAVFSIVWGKLGDKYGKTAPISVAMALVALALGIFISVGDPFVLMLASFLRGASFPMWAFIGATVGAVAPPNSRASWISVVQTVAQTVSILAPYVGGVLYAVTPTTPFVIAVGASLTLVVLAQVRPFRERSSELFCEKC